MQSCDVLIVGGGPGGSSCAWMLQGHGLDILIVDKSDFPRDKTCAGWVTPPVMRLLRIDTSFYARGRVLQPIRGFRSGLIGGRETVTDYDRVISYGIRRCEFDHYLLRRSGSRCQLRWPVKCIRRHRDHWIVNGTLRARVIVGAGGHFCPVARWLGARRQPGASVVAAQEIEIRVDPRWSSSIGICPHLPEIYFCEDLRGYGWCFRKGPYLNVGLGRVDRGRLSAHVARFCRFLTERGKMGDVTSRPFRGHAYQLYESVRPKLVGHGMLLVGDAAGLAYPQSGEGIRPAVESGLMAADVILSSKGPYLPGDLADYEHRIVARFGQPRTARAAWLPASWVRLAARRLMASGWFARNIVMNGWFLHAGEPDLKLAHPTPTGTEDLSYADVQRAGRLN